MNRGAGQKNIYKKLAHKKLFLNLLEDASSLFNIEIHAYCLMSNHYHLLIKTPLGNLSRAMRHINGVYTQLFNKDEKTDGPLFRGRYKAILVSYEEYFLNVNRYIHLNPVSSGMVNHPEDYKWSSYYYYLNQKQKPSWLNTDETLSFFDKNPESFSCFITKGLDEATTKFYETNAKIFGSKIFIDSLLNKLNDELLSAAKTDYNSTRPILPLNDILSVCVSVFKVDRNFLIKNIRGKTNTPRKITIYASRLWSQEKLINIAKIFHCESTSTISDATRFIKTKIKNDNEFKQILNQIYLELLKLSQSNT